MSYSLLVDFGATRIKSALLDDQKAQLSHVKSRPSTPACRQETHVEIPLQSLLHDFTTLCNEYAELTEYNRIFICSQMHGFVLVTPEYKPLTEYISWQDERALQSSAVGESSWSLFSKQFTSCFKEITGMRLRAGFPAVKVLDFVRRYPHYKQLRLLSLPEALLLAGTSFHKVHITMAAGSGLIDFNTQQPAHELIHFIEQFGDGTRLAFNEITEQIVPAGEITVKGRTCTIYTALGDHQCAILGAHNTTDTLSFNLGTGSQVSAICTHAPQTPDTERRHFINHLQLQTITHIPAGRVLEQLIGFYNQLTQKDGWASFGEVTLPDILQASPRFNLAFFPDAWGYNGGGGISNLGFLDLNEKKLWADLFRSFADQYVRAAELFQPRRQKIIISGGKLAKHPALAAYLSQVLQLPVTLTQQGDETLEGLSILARSVK